MAQVLTLDNTPAHPAAFDHHYQHKPKKFKP